MAFTKVAAAGINTTDSFVFKDINTTGVITATSFSGPLTGNVTGNLTGTATTATSLSGTPNVIVGVLTATDAVINGDLTVQGTTTTLDTTLTEVDKLEVGANNTTVGVAITQSGTGDILRLYDGASQVVTIKDGGSVGIGTAIPGTNLEVKGGNSNQLRINNAGEQYTTIDFSNNNTSKSQLFWDNTGTRFTSYVNSGVFAWQNSSNEYMRIDSNGRLLVGTITAVDSALTQISGTKTYTGQIPQGQLNVNDKTAYAAGVGGAIALSGKYHSAGYDTTFGSIEGIKENGTDNNYAGALVFRSRQNGGDNLERMRVDSSGRLLVGVSSAPADSTFVVKSVYGANQPANIYLTSYDTAPSGSGSLGVIKFSDSGQTTAAQIQCTRDSGTWTSGSSQPTRLVFNTTADGASSVTERMRIRSTGDLWVGKTSETSLDPLNARMVIRSSTSNVLALESTVAGGPVNLDFDGRVGNGLQSGPRVRLSQGDGAAGWQSYFAISLGGGGGPITEQMRIDSSGRVTTPNQISFLQVSMSGNSFNNGTMTGGSSDHNVGGHYNTSTGIFTAPIAGYYQFGCGLLVNAGSGRLEGYIGKNGSSTLVNFNGTGTTYDGPTATCIFYLAANDNVRVNRQSGTAYQSNGHGQFYFWGRLLG